MREISEIIFRGKQVDDYEWVYGVPIILVNGETYICHEDKYTDEIHCFLVKPNTITQFTGSNDKNEIKIFEGDIIKTKYGRLCEVSWFSSPNYQGWDLIPIEDKNEMPNKYDLWYCRNLEVIGNIFDNPELLDEKT